MHSNIYLLRARVQGPRVGMWRQVCPHQRQKSVYFKNKFCGKRNNRPKFFDLGHLSFNKNKTQTAVTNICLNCITFYELNVSYVTTYIRSDY